MLLNRQADTDSVDAIDDLRSITNAGSAETTIATQFKAAILIHLPPFCPFSTSLDDAGESPTYRVGAPENGVGLTVTRQRLWVNDLAGVTVELDEEHIETALIRPRADSPAVAPDQYEYRSVRIGDRLPAGIIDVRCSVGTDP